MVAQCESRVALDAVSAGNSGLDAAETFFETPGSWSSVGWLGGMVPCWKGLVTSSLHRLRMRHLDWSDD